MKKDILICLKSSLNFVYFIMHLEKQFEALRLNILKQIHLNGFTAKHIT